MNQKTFFISGLIRQATFISLFLVLIYSHHTCQSFQQAPFALKTRRSTVSPSSSIDSIHNKRHSAHTHFYADPTSSNIHDQTPPPPSFEERMRLQLKQHRSMTSSQQSKANVKNHQLVPDVRDLQNYKQALDKAAEDEKMLAVLWYSPWCKACRAVMPGIRTLAKRHPNVQFIQVPVLPENASLHQGLEVPSVPYLHLYAAKDPRLVEEKKMTRKRLSGFQKLLSDYEKGSCSLEQLGAENQNGDATWSTSNPYLIPNETSTENGNQERNPSEATADGAGATV